MGVCFKDIEGGAFQTTGNESGGLLLNWVESLCYVYGSLWVFAVSQFAGGDVTNIQGIL